MSEDTNNSKTAKGTKKKKSYTTSKKIIFGTLWFLFVFRVFITDIGLVINQKLDGFDTLKFIIVRFLIISLILILFWIKMGNKRFWKNIGLLCAFPIYPFGTGIIKIVGWDIPKFLFNRKYIDLIIIYFDTIVKYFFNLKLNLTILIISLLTFIFLFSFTGYWLILPIISLFFLIGFHLYKRYNQTFEPIKLFQINIENLSRIEGEIFNKEEFEKTISNQNLKKNSKKDIANNKLKDSKNNSDNQEITSKSVDYKNNKIKMEVDKHGKIIDKRLENALVISEFVKIFKHKIEDVLTSRSYMKSFIWKAIYSLFFAMLIFGGINYAIYNIAPINYKSDFAPTFFDFFYYSFFTIIPDGTDIEPVTWLSKSIRMIGVGVGVLINLLILAVYFTVSSDRYKANLEKIVKITDEYSKGANSYFIEKYGHSPTDAIKKLKGKSGEFENQLLLLKSFLRIK